MWLINTLTLELKYFLGDVPDYAILSHRWGPPEDEVTFKEYQKGLKTETRGFDKITSFCHIAQQRDGLEWAWVDTCCIDKRSSSELSEAINSMFHWYRSASVCYAFLDDVEASQWKESVWWTRGWTLQELIAPRNVIFFDRHGREFGDRQTMAPDLEDLTRIPESVLGSDDGFFGGGRFTAAQKMSWAANRTTTGEEDRAYSLLGLFNVNMPLLYGEGSKAFQRLQLEILQQVQDESIFAWASDHRYSNWQTNSVLAKGPQTFACCNHIRPTYSAYRPELEDEVSNPATDRRSPARLTSWGIEVTAMFRKLLQNDQSGLYWVLQLTVAWFGGHRLELPCVLVLEGAEEHQVNRYDCYYGEAASIFEQLTRDGFQVGELEENTFYLSLHDVVAAFY